MPEKFTTVGLLHPGAMGSSIGAAAATNARVLWASEGRSAATAERAASAGLEDARTLEALVAASDLIVSVCPPEAAQHVAMEVVRAGFKGVYLDANAISPYTVRLMHALSAPRDREGMQVVDGGIIGGPAWKPGTTRLYLSGDMAADVAAVFENSNLVVHVLEGPVGLASALKMTYAAYTKGSAAHVAAILATASKYDVLEPLLEEWGRGGGPGERYERQVLAAVPKAWRYVGEMQQIAATFSHVGLPSGFALAAARLYERLEQYRDADPPPPLDAVIAELPRVLPDKRGPRIEVRKVDELDRALEYTTVNFGLVHDAVYKSGLDAEALPWLTSINPYGNTLINSQQAQHVIRELENLLPHVAAEEAAVARATIELLRGLDFHQYLKFIGD